MLVKEAAREFRIDSVLIMPMSPEEGRDVVGCDSSGWALWASRTLDVEDVESQAVELGCTAFGLDFY